ncbi:MAG TPA: cytochrome c biogenesis protein CcdA [Desulfatiglandales bacterium]|nr:cytochrome c biogenesis protein CcdA [Desulfatiglandales bacterium]
MMAIFFPSPSWTATVETEIIHSTDNYLADGTSPILFRLNIQKSWYIHGAIESESDLIPTRIIFHDSPYLKVKGVRYPEAEKIRFEYLTEPISVYSGSIIIKASLSPAKDIPLGIKTINGILSYQACSSSACLSPEEIPLELRIKIVPQGTAINALNTDLFLSTGDEKGAITGAYTDSFDTGLLLTLLGLFLGGLALNLTPCIYPLIPITVSYFGGKSNRISGKRILHGILYLSGLAVTNSFLGLSSALSGSMLGSALQNPVVLIFIALIMAFLGLSFFGIWELRLPAILTRTASKNYPGYFGTFFMGLTLGIVAAPCLGPFILGLLTYVGQRGDPFLGFLYFFTLSIGMGLPLCILAVFSGAIDHLPISGDWMIWIKKILGWVLVGMALYIISPLIPGDIGIAWPLAGVAAISAVHLGWIDRTGGGRSIFIYFKRGICAIILALSILFLFYTYYTGEGIKWIPFNQEVLSSGLKAKKPIMFEIFADWCLPCRAMEKRAFKDPEVVSISKDILCVRMDLTRKQSFQEEIMKRYHIRGVPTIIFINREGKEEDDLRIESYVDNTELLHRMTSLLLDK